MGPTNVKAGTPSIKIHSITAMLNCLVIIVNVRGPGISGRQPLGTGRWRSNVAFKWSWDSDLN
jgi:hypothetical protein